jgi:hypothetical protein
MAFGRKTGGRQKGTPNKLSVAAKDNFISVFEELNGEELTHMKTWAAENPNQFYALYAKLLPLQLNGSGEDGEFEHNLTVQLVSAITK